MQSSWSRWLPYLLILAVGCVSLLPQLGIYGFWDPWEPKYAQSAREMIERDSLWIPYYRGEVRLTKPILVYWGIVAGVSTFGDNEFGARIGGVVLALASMLGLYYAVSRVRSRRVALWSALILGTLPQFVLLSRQATPDVYLFTTLGTGVAFFAAALFGPERSRTLHFVIAYVAFSLAVMAKGPVIVAAVFLGPLALYGALRIDWAHWWGSTARAGLVRNSVVALLSVGLTKLATLAGFFSVAAASWLWYESSKFTRVVSIRDGFLQKWLGSGLDRVCLVAVLLWAGFLIFRVRSSGPARSRSLLLAVCASVASIAVLGQFLPDSVRPGLGFFGLAALGILTALRALLALLALPELGTALRPWVRLVLRQSLIFAGVFLVVAGPWHLVVLYQQSNGYFTDFIIKHNIQRAGGTINSSGTAAFYLETMIFGYFPWSCLIPVVFAGLVRWWDRKPLVKYDLESYLLATVAVTFAGFSISETKFHHYLAPMLIPMAVLLALTLDALVRRKGSVAATVACLIAALLYLLPMTDLLRPEGGKYLIETFSVKRGVPDDYMLWPPLQLTVLLLALLWVAFALFRRPAIVAVMLACGTLFAHGTAARFVPEIAQHKSMKGMCESWLDTRTPAEPICFYGERKHGVYYHCNSEAVILRKRRRAVDFLNPERGAYCIIEGKKLPDVYKDFRKKYPKNELYVVDGTHGRYALVANREVPEKDSLPVIEAAEQRRIR